MRINIEIGDIEAFIELTETNSFAKAAVNLNLSQPALSRRIQKLEYELGTTLLIALQEKYNYHIQEEIFMNEQEEYLKQLKQPAKHLMKNTAFHQLLK